MGSTAPKEEDFAQRLRDAGLRLTMPRRAIGRILARSTHEFLTASMILDAVESEFGRLDPSTVYRTLDEFGRLGLVHHLHLGGGRAGTWHLTVETDHQHLVCERCGKTQEVPAEELESAYAVLLSNHGFRPNTHHFTILGYCEECLEEDRSPSDA